MSSKNSRLLIPAVFISLVMSSCSFFAGNSESVASSETISGSVSSVPDSVGGSFSVADSSSNSLPSSSSRTSSSSSFSLSSSSSKPSSSSSASSLSSLASSSEATHSSSSESSSSIPAHEHTFNTEWDGDENNHWHNATCGHDVRSDEGPHNYVAGTVVPPTYEADGYTIYTCSVCGRSKRGNVTTKLSHSYSEAWSYDENEHWHACTDAGFEGKEHGKDNAQHDFEDEVIEADYEHGGCTKHKCKVCGYETESNVTDPLTHNYSTEWSSDGEKHWHACVDVGYETALKADEAEHQYEGWVTDKEATIGETGLKHADCTVCGHRETSVIPALAEFEGDFGYILLNDGSGYSVFAANKDISGEVNLPSEHNGLPVKGIGTARGIADFTVDEEYTTVTPPSFQDCVNITKVNIPDSIEFIGDFAFDGCYGLTRAEIPQNIKYVGMAAYANLDSLDTIFLDIPSLKVEGGADENNYYGVTWFSYATFIVDAIPEFVYEPRDITLIIGEHCNIDSYFMYTLDYYGFVYHGFRGWSDENRYQSGASIYEITNIVVEENNSFVTFENSALYTYDGTEILFVVKSQISPTNKLKIKDTVTSLDYYILQLISGYEPMFEIDESSGAWYIGSELNPYMFLLRMNKTDITSFAVPSGCKYIYSYFDNLTSLTMISVPDSVLSLDPRLFEKVASLQSFNVSPDNPNYSSLDGALYNKDMTEILLCPRAKTSITLPSSVTTIGYYSFYCSSIESIVIPSGVTYLPESFAECESLKNIKILNPNTTVDKNAFARCTNIERFEGTLEQWLSIEHGFDGHNIPMWGLNIHLYLNGSDEESTSIDVTSDVASLCADDFNCFVSLESINVSSDNPNYASYDGVLFNKGLTEVISCPRAKTSITLPSSVTAIGEQAFYRSSLVSIILHSGVTTVGSLAFYYCSSLESITIPSTVTSFNAGFSGCTSLTTINYGGTINQWRELCQGELFSPFEPGPESVVVHCTDGEITLVNRFF